ncbi:hypothetical protein ACWCRI_29320, partial [Streptomyces collinus]
WRRAATAWCSTAPRASRRPPPTRRRRTWSGPWHRSTHALAGRALVVAASRADTAAAILAAERMDAHTAALMGPKELSTAR